MRSLCAFTESTQIKRLLRYLRVKVLVQAIEHPLILLESIGKAFKDKIFNDRFANILEI